MLLRRKAFDGIVNARRALSCNRASMVSGSSLRGVQPFNGVMQQCSFGCKRFHGGEDGPSPPTDAPVRRMAVLGQQLSSAASPATFSPEVGPVSTTATARRKVLHLQAQAACAAGVAGRSIRRQQMLTKLRWTKANSSGAVPQYACILGQMVGRCLDRPNAVPGTTRKVASICSKNKKRCILPGALCSVIVRTFSRTRRSNYSGESATFGHRLCSGRAFGSAAQRGLPTGGKDRLGGGQTAILRVRVRIGAARRVKKRGCCAYPRPMLASRMACRQPPPSGPSTCAKARDPIPNVPGSEMDRRARPKSADALIVPLVGDEGRLVTITRNRGIFRRRNHRLSSDSVVVHPPA